MTCSRGLLRVHGIFCWMMMYKRSYSISLRHFSFSVLIMLLLLLLQPVALRGCNAMEWNGIPWKWVCNSDTADTELQLQSRCRIKIIAPEKELNSCCVPPIRSSVGLWRAWGQLGRNEQPCQPIDLKIWDEEEDVDSNLYISEVKCSPLSLCPSCTVKCTFIFVGATH